MSVGVVIVQTGVANTASVAAALRRCGAEPILTDEAGAVADADAVVLPGVGSFGAGMDRLRERGLSGVLRERIEAARPTLAICLGLQMLCASSEESPGVEGIGVIDATVARFPAGVRVPQFGWNRVEADRMSVLVESGFAYYANAYRLAAVPDGWVGSMTDHGESFVAAAERGGILACQFHPELSGPWGLGVLTRWLALAEETSC